MNVIPVLVNIAPCQKYNLESHRLYLFSPISFLLYLRIILQ